MDTDQDTSITYDIINEQTRERVVTTKEDLKFHETSKDQKQFTLPETLVSGRYLIRATIEYGAKTTSDSLTFSVGSDSTSTPGTQEIPLLSKPSLTPGQCTPSCNDYDACTRDLCTDGSCVFESITPCCGNFECESGETESTCAQDCKPRPLTQGEAIGEIRKRAEQMAASKTADAVTLCKSIAVLAQADSCLEDVATLSEKSDICSSINGPKLRDSCYLDFALKKKQGNVCEHITDRWMAQSCTIYTSSQ